jgi:hypothetical protein
MNKKPIGIIFDKTVNRILREMYSEDDFMNDERDFNRDELQDTPESQNDVGSIKELFYDYIKSVINTGDGDPSDIQAVIEYLEGTSGSTNYAVEKRLRELLPTLQQGNISEETIDELDALMNQIEAE